MSDLFAAYATIPEPVALVVGLALGGAAGWLGWEAGKSPKRGLKTAAPA